MKAVEILFVCIKVALGWIRMQSYVTVISLPWAHGITQGSCIDSLFEILTLQKYQPYASDPNLSGALASVLWELNLLSKHYHPTVSAMASSVSSISTGHNQVYLSIISPQQAFSDLSLKGESFNLQSDNLKLNNKRKRGSGSSRSARVAPLPDTVSVNDDEVRKKLSTHFTLLRDIKENERLRGDLDRTTFYLKLYEEHRKQQKKKGRDKTHEK